MTKKPFDGAKEDDQDEIARAKAEAMGPRKNPMHPMFRDHNCPYCGSGRRPCRMGNPSQCEYPHARNY